MGNLGLWTMGEVGKWYEHSWVSVASAADLEKNWR